MSGCQVEVTQVDGTRMMRTARILVVDDEQELKRLIQQRFRKKIAAREIDFIFASNGVEALQKLQEERGIDLVLTDINMPEMDGLTLIDALSKISNSLKAVVMSAYSDMSNVRQAMNLGAFDFLSKPIDFKELEKTIEKTQKYVQQLKTKQLETQNTQIQQEQLKLQALHRNISLSLSHEINTPLSSILGFTDFLLHYYASTFETEALEAFQCIHDSAVRLERLCQNFLFHAQFELWAMQPERREQLKREITYAPHNCLEKCAQKQAAYYERMADLTVMLIDTPVQISEMFLKKIADELLDNAFKFSTVGTPVFVQSVNLGSRYQIRVSDRGRGMSADQITHIEAYVQFNREHHEQQGVGLGLAIIERILQFHDGVMRIESLEGQGTTVIIELPTARLVNGE